MKATVRNSQVERATPDSRLRDGSTPHSEMEFPSLPWQPRLPGCECPLLAAMKFRLGSTARGRTKCFPAYGCSRAARHYLQSAMSSRSLLHLDRQGSRRSICLLCGLCHGRRRQRNVGRITQLRRNSTRACRSSSCPRGRGRAGPECRWASPDVETRDFAAECLAVGLSGDDP